MAAVDIQIHVDDDRPTAKLRAVGSRIDGAGLTAYMKGFVAPYLQERAQERFALEGDDASGPWRPLQDSTIAHRTSRGYVPIKINDRTGQMKLWVTQAKGRVVAVKTAAAYEWPGSPKGSTLRRKLKHAQTGDPENRTPPRPVVALSEADVIVIVGAMEEWINSAQ